VNSTVCQKEKMAKEKYLKSVCKKHQEAQKLVKKNKHQEAQKMSLKLFKRK
jgi:hypothetical protein